jgi:hypothetical protein
MSNIALTLADASRERVRVVARPVVEKPPVAEHLAEDSDVIGRIIGGWFQESRVRGGLNLTGMLFRGASIRSGGIHPGPRAVDSLDADTELQRGQFK